MLGGSQKKGALTEPKRNSGISFAHSHVGMTVSRALMVKGLGLRVGRLDAKL